MRLLFALSLIASILSVPAEAAIARCPEATPGATTSMVVPGSDRQVLVRWPRGQRTMRSMPTVLLLHGSGGTAASMLERSGLAVTADANGFLIVAPQGVVPSGAGFVWNIPGVPAVGGRIPGPEDADDVRYVALVIDGLVDQGCTDRRRVYATGLSGGGRMASLLGCVEADRIAAIAPVVGLRAGIPSKSDTRQVDAATCRPSRPMPIMAFAGDADDMNPIAGGGLPYWRYSMRTAEARWAELNGCRKPLTTRRVTRNLYQEGYTQCRDDADVIARITIGGKHEWLADNDVMWKFFSEHRLDR